ncbi:hypothetical protein FRC14_001138 [Serendipita sp. 396]|nr:hypothetical protein FRC14_001138 [Serendipita sp. 396]KAG8773842.1 hypothetical protein FRC15_001725 [Serendipita sp. 397]KAG8825137.1 hypothetical protein FRC19_000333 [Serendipita sp. 401]KAG8848259.1 hypothetical protein FRB91_010986 [Serendipita sp. 411]KAG8851448.1 hypothetical protein FRC20_001755 [Serendipita sp. 405]
MIVATVIAFVMAALSVTASPAMVESRDLETPPGFNITSVSVTIPYHRHRDNFATEHGIDNE